MFTEKTIKRLADMGFDSSVVVEQGQFRETEYSKGWVHIFETNNTCSIEISVYYREKPQFLENHTLRYETLKALKLAEQAEEIIKENGK
jgi:hypothetical protein